MFSTKDFKDLKLVENTLVNSYTNYTVEGKLLNGEKIIEGYVHVFDISFVCLEFVLQELKVCHQENIYKVPIGMYQTLFLEGSTMDISSSIDVDNHLGKINVQNNLYCPIYYLSHEIVSIRKAQEVSKCFVDRTVVYSKNLKHFEIFKIEMRKKYHQVGGIVQTKFKSSMSEYLIYTSYYYSLLPSVTELVEDGVSIESLETIKKSW